MIKKLIIVFSIIIFYLNDAKTQNLEFYGKKYEVGLNVTGLLGNLLSLDQNTEQVSPYILLLRKHTKKSTIRFDLNTVYKTSSDFDINGIKRELGEFNLDVRFGVEKIKVLNKRFAFGYGIDLVGGYTESNSLVSSFFIEKSIIGIGLGPCIRLHFKLSERVVLSTESTFYGEVFQNSTSGNVGVTNKVNNYSVELAKPYSLFLTVLL